MRGTCGCESQPANTLSEDLAEVVQGYLSAPHTAPGWFAAGALTDADYDTASECSDASDEGEDEREQNVSGRALSRVFEWHTAQEEHSDESDHAEPAAKRSCGKRGGV